jgi:RNA polymerase sigma-70 factor (ECF subfamily)
MAASTEPASGRSEFDGALVREIRGRLERAIARLCPPQLAASADDIVQVAILRVVQIMQERADDGEGIAAPGPSYLWKVAYTTTVDELRKMQSRERTRNNVAEPARALSPESILHAAEISTALRYCLAGLREDRRRAVVLHLQGHTILETGTLLGWDRKRAENLIYRGLADLRRCLGAKGYEP